MVSRVREWGRRVLRGPHRPALDGAVRLLAAMALAGVLALPLALAWAVTRTDVHGTVGITPTTFSLTTAGHSELRLGVAGTVYLPMSRGPFGVVAAVDGPGDPGAGNGDLATYVTPQMLELYTGLFHDPGPAIEGYVDLLARELRYQFLLAELTLAGIGGVTLFSVSLLAPRGVRTVDRRRLRRVAAASAVVLASTVTLAVVAAWPADPDEQPRAGVYSLPALDGTVASGSTTNSPVLRALLGGAVPKVRDLVRRQEEGVKQYRDEAAQSLREQASLMTGPRPGETAVLMESDMHCNITMIGLQAQVDSMLRDRFGEGVPALMAIAGDLTTNGTAAEKTCVEDEAAIAGGAPVAAVTGNHESDVSVAQMKKAGMKVLDGSVVDVGGVSVLGAGDPDRSELFGDTRLRGTETEPGMGKRLYDVARENPPELVLMHEAYAAQAFVGVRDMPTFLAGRGSDTVPYPDGVRDLPAAAVFYGHWHRSVAPRVVWNSDGTWTLVMELDTSGGAIDTPTIGHFSTPWSRPQQEASFPVVFLDKESHLVTGYQLYRFRTDATVSVLPRVDIGVAGTVP